MDTSYIKSLIQNILNKTFSEANRRNIISYDDRLNFCCPVCMDSEKDAHKKRGNIYFDRLLFICFNCGVKISLSNLCKENSIYIDPLKKMEMIKYLDTIVSKRNFKSDMSEVDLSNLINLSDLEKVLNNKEQNLTEFKPIVKDGLQYNYLLGRGIDDKKHKDIYQAKHWTSPNRYEPVIVFLNRKDNKLLGIQTRNLRSGKQRQFKIYNFETIYKWINKVDEITDIPEIQVIIYNKLSYFFNILNIDFENTITIFEGFLDSLFYPNSMGMVGLNTMLDIMENDSLDIQYFFDNDEAGYTKSEEKIKKGYKIFLWRKLFKFVVDKKKPEDPYKLMERISKIKDLNKLNELSNNAYAKLELYKYFSKDVFDLVWLPKKQVKKFKTFHKFDL
jgi:hypothetical protein